MSVCFPQNIRKMNNYIAKSGMTKVRGFMTKQLRLDEQVGDKRETHYNVVLAVLGRMLG